MISSLNFICYLNSPLPHYCNIFTDSGDSDGDIFGRPLFCTPHILISYMGFSLQLKHRSYTRTWPTALIIYPLPTPFTVQLIDSLLLKLSRLLSTLGSLHVHTSPWNPLSIYFTYMTPCHSALNLFDYLVPSLITISLYFFLVLTIN